MFSEYERYMSLQHLPKKQLEAPRSLNRSPVYHGITLCRHKHCMEVNYDWKTKFDSTIMFSTSNYPKISIFIEIGQCLHSCDMAAILKKMAAQKKNLNNTIMFATQNYP